jgi:hypothetical protein
LLDGEIVIVYAPGRSSLWTVHVTQVKEGTIFFDAESRQGWVVVLVPSAFGVFACGLVHLSKQTRKEMRLTSKEALRFLAALERDHSALE